MKFPFSYLYVYITFSYTFAINLESLLALDLLPPQVRQVLNGGVAQKDGRLKRGDRIVSVNGQTLAGLDNKGALLVLRDAGAGDTVTLVVCRKLGRRTSLPPTPMPGSTRQSRYLQSSGQASACSGGRGGGDDTSIRYSKFVVERLAHFQA